MSETHPSGRPAPVYIRHGAPIKPRVTEFQTDVRRLDMDDQPELDASFAVRVLVDDRSKGTLISVFIPADNEMEGELSVFPQVSVSASVVEGEELAK